MEAGATYLHILTKWLILTKTKNKTKNGHKFCTGKYKGFTVK